MSVVSVVIPKLYENSCDCLLIIYRNSFFFFFRLVNFRRKTIRVKKFSDGPN